MQRRGPDIENHSAIKRRPRPHIEPNAASAHYDAHSNQMLIIILQSGLAGTVQAFLSSVLQTYGKVHALVFIVFYYTFCNFFIQGGGVVLPSGNQQQSSAGGSKKVN